LQVRPPALSRSKGGGLAMAEALRVTRETR